MSELIIMDRGCTSHCSYQSQSISSGGMQSNGQHDQEDINSVDNNRVVGTSNPVRSVRPDAGTCSHEHCLWACSINRPLGMWGVNVRIIMVDTIQMSYPGVPFPMIEGRIYVVSSDIGKMLIRRGWAVERR